MILYQLNKYIILKIVEYNIILFKVNHMKYNFMLFKTDNVLLVQTGVYIVIMKAQKLFVNNVEEINIFKIINVKIVLK